MSQTPANWYADPEDPAQDRYWDGAAWTDSRRPRRVSGGEPAGTAERLTATGHDVAEGIAGALSSVGTWVQEQTSSTPQQPTFASVAASCRDEPPRQPLSTFVELSLEPSDLYGVGTLCAAAGVTITPDGVQLSNELCRLAPNPWDPQDPTGVGVLVGTHLLGRLPADIAQQYSAPLTRLTRQRLLATGTATVWAQGEGVPTRARVALSLPDPGAFGT